MELAEKRKLARELFTETVAAVAPARLLSRCVSVGGNALRVANAEFKSGGFKRLLVCALGKAAVPMQTAWMRCVGDLVKSEGVVCSPDTHEGVAGFKFFCGGHPEPNEASLAAADAMLALADSADEQTVVVYLISGGGSALAERPGMQLTLLELKETYRALVLGGAPIGEINTIRKHLSAFKGGRLALRAAARGAQQISLIISDVAGSDAGEVSSGPTLPDRSTVEDCYRIARQRGLRFPPPVQRVFDERSLAETPKPANPAFAKTSWHVLMDNDTACTVLAERARLLGLAPEIDHTSDEWEYKRAADFLVKRLQELRRQAPNACLISGGEVLVKVANGGTGGRNQQLALACAMRIAGSDVCVLSGGTDGIDGNSDGAGAVVDGTTVERLKKAGFNAQRQLEAFDAYPALRAIGDTLVTGLTGNNVRDLRLLL